MRFTLGRQRYLCDIAELVWWRHEIVCGTVMCNMTRYARLRMSLTCVQSWQKPALSLTYDVNIKRYMTRTRYYAIAVSDYILHSEHNRFVWDIDTWWQFYHVTHVQSELYSFHCSGLDSHFVVDSSDKRWRYRWIGLGGKTTSIRSSCQSVQGAVTLLSACLSVCCLSYCACAGRLTTRLVAALCPVLSCRLIWFHPWRMSLRCRRSETDRQTGHISCRF